MRHREIDDSAARRRGAGTHAFEGSHRNDVPGKVGKLFAELRAKVL